MFILKVTTFFLMALAVGAEKKIELLDIEDDNLRSEMRSEQEKEHDKSDTPQTSASGTGSGFNSLDFMKAGLLKFFEKPGVGPQQQRYVHQYAVTEPPERNVPSHNKPQFGPSAPQQAMVGYLSNIPMQIYLVPQYYSDHAEQSNPPHSEFQQPDVSRVAYQSAPQAVKAQSNYADVPAYVPPKPFVQHYAPPQSLTYVTYSNQPPAPQPQATVAPVVAYQLPVFQYNPSLVAPTNIPKVFYANPEYSDTNSLDDVPDRDQKQYSSQSEVPYHVVTEPEYPRHYNSRTPIRDHYRPHPGPELPYPNPLLLKAPPPHLAHIPKILPMYRPSTKPVYQGGEHVPSSFTPRPHDHYNHIPFKRRPTSLLDSYIPSSLQVEYLKRGLIKEPSSAYEALASGRLPHSIPRHYERGFLPNQMYHTAAGGVTYGHYKRNPKVEKLPQK